MEYNNDEYLKLFKQIKQQYQNIETKDYTFEQLRGNENPFAGQMMIKETPDYMGFMNEPNINEVCRYNYSQDINLNEFNIETRINGQNINEVRRHDKEERLNEVMEHLRQERLKAQETQKLNEVVNWDADVITLEMFNKARFNSMMQVAKILPK